ncbi:MAG: hypothetical protein AAF890_03420 [Pseudomonadota bacterium]
MTHPRTTFRNALVAQLAAANVSGGNVKAARPSGNAVSDLPETRVFVLGETAERQGSCQPWLRRPLVVVHTQFTASPTTLDDQADANALAIEKAIEADTTLGGAAREILPPSTDIRFSEAGQNVGVVTLTYEVEFEGSPS